MTTEEPVARAWAKVVQLTVELTTVMYLWREAIKEYGRVKRESDTGKSS